VIRIAITAEAFEAIAATMPLDSVGYERERAATGGYFIWLDERTVNRLRAQRGKGEDWSEVILRLATAERP
jgi:hypothetical protein